MKFFELLKKVQRSLLRPFEKTRQDGEGLPTAGKEDETTDSARTGARLKFFFWLSVAVVVVVAFFGAVSFSENLRAFVSKPNLGASTGSFATVAATGTAEEPVEVETLPDSLVEQYTEHTEEEVAGQSTVGTTVAGTPGASVTVSLGVPGGSATLSAKETKGEAKKEIPTTTGIQIATPSVKTPQRVLVPDSGNKTATLEKQEPKQSAQVRSETENSNENEKVQTGEAQTPEILPPEQTTEKPQIDDDEPVQSDETEHPEPVETPAEPSRTVSSTWSGEKEKFAFVKEQPTSVFDAPESGNVIGTLKVGDFVKVLDERTVDDKKFTKILRRTTQGNLVGWVRSSKLASTLSEVLGEGYEDITFPVMSKRVGRVKNVRGIFLTRYSVNTPARLRQWIAFAKRNNLNAFVIDVKDDDGFLLFKTKIAETIAPRANAEAFYTKEQMRELLSELKDNGIYVIARIVCFKDPTYARTHPNRAIVYKDTGEPYKGIYKVPWASAYDRQLWKYNVEVAKETAEVGFDEIQYDYIRFPELTKEQRRRLNLREVPGESFAEAIQKFVLYAKTELMRYNVPLALDVFGLVCTAIDDVGIGQHWEALSSIVDYMCPMVYPSHYAYGSFGLPVPDAYPYETVYNSVLDGIKRNLQLASPARIRPWIQSFTAPWVKGHIVYDEAAIRKQIKALKDLGINEYMLWNAANKYHEMHYD